MRQLLTLLICTIAISLSAQYEFTHSKDLNCTSVKNQSRTGTCWSFATASFIESELMRQGKGEHDLSEMFVVHNIYKDKARNYVLRQGKANFSQGSLSHDLIRMIAREGVVPESVYTGLMEGESSHNHSEMEAGLKGFLDGILKSKRLSKKWMPAFESILAAYIGSFPSEFEYNDKTYTPESLAAELELNASDYTSLTSFTHHPYNSKFILEIPDNYSNGAFYNVTLDELMNTIDNAIAKGYSVAWDGDVSEKGFSAREGIAVLPEDASREDLFTTPGPELNVTADLRQEHFESYSTTDDHLMHIVGSAKDQNGTEYYIIKNSWGEISPYKGYLFMSKAYAKMKTVAIMVHKDVLSDRVKSNMSEE